MFDGQALLIALLLGMVVARILRMIFQPDYFIR